MHCRPQVAMQNAIDIGKVLNAIVYTYICEAIVSLMCGSCRGLADCNFARDVSSAGFIISRLSTHDVPQGPPPAGLCPGPA